MVRNTTLFVSFALTGYEEVLNMGTINNDEFVYVPIPHRLLPEYCRWLPSVMVETTEREMVAASIPDTQRRNLNVIDLSIDAAREIGADQHPVSLADLHAAYLRANPGIGKGTTQDSFGATINYHTINMRSRFPDRGHKQKLASWLSRPVFKRVAYGRYMLLSPNELALFQQRVEVGDPRIYEDEFDINDLA
jgi:hypothetical protein